MRTPVLLCALALLLASLLHTPAAACTSGILQLKPSPNAVRIPFFSPASGYDCLWFPATTNSIKAACGVTLKVTVDKGVVKVAPLSRETYSYGDPNPAGPIRRFNCKDMNGTGLFAAGSTTDARITLYDNLGGPLTNLTRTGPNQITLTPGKEYAETLPPGCKFNYTVISGCVFGIKAPAKPPACPSGYHLKPGASKAKFCAPCPPGTSSRGPNAAACTPCRPGTFANTLGSACRPCRPPTCSTKPGSTDCNAICPSKCPTGSVPDESMPGRCVQCAAGRKCCTVGAGRGCPACAAGAKASAATSVFALESATPARCLATPAARCTPTFNVTVDATCRILIENNNDNGNNGTFRCQWGESVQIKGATPSIAADIRPFMDQDEAGLSPGSLFPPKGTIKASAPASLDFTIPATKCTLRYRALTAPIATLLGVPPKPSPLTPCPLGKFRDTTTDARPGPCLPCRPGTYATKAGACTPCKAGTYAGSYGARACTPCPKYQLSKAGAAACDYCPRDTLPNSSGRTCTSCPAGTGITFEASGRCLAISNGTVCCAAGDCGKDPKCPTPLRPPRGNGGQSVLKVVATNHGNAACKNYALMKCLKVNDALSMTGTTLSKIGPLCPPLNVNTRYYGGYASATRAYFSGSIRTSFIPRVELKEGYELLPDAKQGTITMYAAPHYNTFYDIPVAAAFNPACSVTLKLAAGAVFDQKTPTGTKCAPNLVAVTSNGITYCNPCSWSTYLKGGQCVKCPNGTYSDYDGATKCTPCTPGNYCSLPGPATSDPCPAGTYTAKPRQTECTPCPRNTYSNRQAGSTGCLPCPKGQTSPRGSIACNLPFL